MTEWGLSLLPEYGLWLLGLTTFLSCLAIPAPSSLMMLAAGGFVASGDLDLLQVAAAAFAGAVLGDQTGFHLARRQGPELMRRIKASGRRASLLARAEALISRYGGSGIFLTRWLFSALGPWANFAAGATGFSRSRFSFTAAAGEVVWVFLYVGMGYAFAGNLEAAADLLGSVIGLLAAGAAALILGLWLRAALRHNDRA